MIGIHLGANYTRVAIMKDSYPIMVREIDIPRDGNADRLASVVSFRNNQIRFGTEAFKTQDHEIIFDACRAAPNYKSDIWHAKRSDDGKYTVRGLKENDGIISQEEVISKILTRIRDIVETKYGDNFIQRVVLSYPPECIQTYKDMLKKAAKNAFNRDVELLEEREAAAKTFYKLSPPSQDPHHLLVFKFGAGSLGISIFEKKNDENNFKQLESTSDPNMGGEDITNLLIWHCQKEFKEKLEESEIRNKQLRESCERVKSDLSYFAETKIFLDGDPLCDFTRDNFESLLKDNDIIENIESRLQTIAKIIQSKGITINDVLLVGGSTRLHFIRNLIDTALKTDENIEYHYDTVVNPEEAIAMGCAIFSDNLKDITNSSTPEIPNTSLEEKVPEDSPSSLKEDKNVPKYSPDPSTDSVDVEANETTPLTSTNSQQQNPKSSMNLLNLSQSNLNIQSFNTKYDTDDNKLSELFDDQNLKTVEKNSTSNISIKSLPTRTSINEEGKSQVEETKQEDKSQEEENKEKKRQEEERQEEERQKKKKQDKKGQEEEKQVEESKQDKNRQKEEERLKKKSQEEKRQEEEKRKDKKRQEEESQEKERQEKRLDEYEETCMKPDEIDMPRSSTKKEKSQIKQNLKYENIEKTVHSKKSTTSSASSESSNYKTKPTDKTKGLNNDRGHLIVKGNFSNHTKETLYNQINYWLDSIIKFKHISSVEKEHFASTYGKTAINKLPRCTGDEVLLMDLVARAELRYQTLKYKNDILEQFNQIKDALGYIKENKKFLDKLNEKRKEVEETSIFKIIDAAYDACMNDLHQLLGILQDELKRPPRSANTKVSKWQEDELVKVLIKPQIHNCVYTIGN